MSGTSIASQFAAAKGLVDLQKASIALANQVDAGGGSTGSLPWVNVRDYLADPTTAGNGVVDETAAIAAAVNAIVTFSANGGIVHYGPGRHVASSVPWPTGVIHQGEGRAATEIFQKAGSNTTTFLKTTNYDTLAGTDTSVTPWGFGLREITINGNKTGQTSGTGHGLGIYGCGYIIDNVRVTGFRGKAMVSEWSTTTPPAETQVGGSMESFVTNFVFDNCNGGAIKFEGPHDTQFLNGIAARCGNNVSGDIVIDLPSDGKANGSTFTGIHIWGAKNDHGFRINASGISINNCQVEGSLVSQIWITASLNQVTGGKLFAGYPPAQASVGIKVGAGVNNLDIDTKVENLTGGVVDLSAGGAGNNRVRVLASYLAGVATPAAAVIGTIDNNSEYAVSVVDASGTLDPTLSIWRRGVISIKPSYMSIGPTPNSGILLFLKSQTDGQKGILLAQCSDTQTADLFIFQDSSFANLFRFEKWGRPVAEGATVTISPGAQAATAVAGARGAKDGAGHVVVTAVGSPVAGALATITFAHTWSAAPKAPQLSANSAAAATAGLYVSSVNTASFTISCANAPAASAVLDIGWTTVG